MTSPTFKSTNGVSYYTTKIPSIKDGKSKSILRIYRFANIIVAKIATNKLVNI